MKRIRSGFVLSLGLVPLILGLAGNGIAGSTDRIDISLAQADVTLVGEQIGDWAAYSASPAGDVNGDGFADLVIGAPFAVVGPRETATVATGKAYLILGRPEAQWPSDDIVLSQADASFRGCLEGGMTARQNYTAGDVNGDGYDDWLLSGWKCSSDQPYQGKAFLFLGKPNVNWGHDFPVEGADASFLGEHSMDFAAYYVSTAGDVNGDGLDDFLITSPQNSDGGPEAGEVYLMLGRAAADWGTDYPLAQADASFLGEIPADRVGRSATGVGDVNGDGYGDFLIGSIESDEGGDDAGQSYLILGRAEADWGMHYSLAAADASFLGEAAGDESGRRVAGAGDVNGDGYDDLLIGASRNSQVALEAGKAYLILGRAEADWGMDFPLALADASFLGEGESDQAGRRASGAGDVNSDGYADLLIGAPHSDAGVENAGAAYLLYGRPLADWGADFSLSQADVAYLGETAFDAAGYDLSGVGDVDGDGVDDLLIGAYGSTRHDPTSPGRAYLVLSDGGPQPTQFTPDSPNGKVKEWHSFSGRYLDPNGWQDIATAQLVLGRNPEDRKGLNVKYEAAENGLYLRDGAGTGWLGPCTPGQPVRLNNLTVQLDCSQSTVTDDGDRTLEVSWRARWLRPVSRPLVMTAFLRAADQGGGDSGFLSMGTWTLLPVAE